ncbi:MAG: DUF1579 family protein [Candidatus Aminicenantes bacterium]|nr:MAG: DUF1579 family protein [Candidatus Aminicenantes bacterium]
MKKLLGLFLILIVIVVTPFTLFPSGDTFTEQMKKLEPFVGKWKTRSFYPGKDAAIPGELEYRWVLGENWLLVEFVGQHPERDFWEAYVMIKFDVSKNLYVSYAFFTANGPTIMTGSWISTHTFRLETKDEKGNSISGIDYTVKTDGTIYQENWVIDKNKEKKITLKTYYNQVK